MVADGTSHADGAPPSPSSPPSRTGPSALQVGWAHLWRAAILGGVGFVAVVVLALSGLGGTNFGLAKVTLILIVAGPVAAAVISAGLPTISRRILLVLTSLLAVTFAAVIWWQAPVMSDRLAEVVADVPTPSRAASSGDFAGGNAMCFDVCPSYTASFVFDGNVEAAIEAFTDALAAAGYGVERQSGPILWVARARPQVDLTVSFGPGPTLDDATTAVSLTANGRRR